MGAQLFLVSSLSLSGGQELAPAASSLDVVMEAAVWNEM